MNPADQAAIKNIAQKIDHTLLKPEATSKEIEKICAEAIHHGFFGVCVNSVYISLVTKLLKGSSVKPVSVIGFPLGASDTNVKVFECGTATDLGAEEIDMVLSIGALKEGLFKEVEKDIEAVVKEAWGRTVKVIIETSLLNQTEKINACKIVSQSGAQFIKTSTGFAGGGATFEDVVLFKKHLADHVLIKASGGIKNLETAQRFLDLGVSRLGTSSGVQILMGLNTEGSY
ncbi:MAG: deoxyribose-phosphate aldolase [Bdellovibrionota bacterium]